jgi:hypothetical protein
MAYDFVRGNSQSFNATISFITQPLTVALWIRRTGGSTLKPVNLSLNGGNEEHSTASDSSRFYAGNTNAAGAGSSGQITISGTDVWVQGAAVYTSQRARPWANGSQGGLSGGDRLVSNFDRLWIGRSDVNFPEPMSGQLAEIAVWSVELNSAEMNSLAKGFRPTRIRPQSLVYYVPLIRNVVELKAALTFTTSASSPTVFAHPRVY